MRRVALAVCLLGVVGCSEDVEPPNITAGVECTLESPCSDGFACVDFVGAKTSGYCFSLCEPIVAECWVGAELGHCSVWTPYQSDSRGICLPRPGPYDCSSFPVPDPVVLCVPPASR